MKLSCGLIVTSIPDFSGITDAQKEYWTKWIAALRSGDYKQARGWLRSTSGFCCLGVATDIGVQAGVGSWKTWQEDGFSHSVKRTEDADVRNESFLSNEIMDIFGLPYSDGLQVGVNSKTWPDEVITKANRPSLADLNDSGVVTFEDIALILETALAGGLNAEASSSAD